MSSDDFEQRFRHHVEFMLEQQARFDERLESMHARFEERFNKLEDVQAQQAENINGLLEAVAALTAQAEANRSETREAINSLIVTNEVTRKLSEDVARLAIQTSQRVTNLELK